MNEKQKDTELYVAIGRLEEKINQMMYIKTTADNANLTATKAEESASSAHKRIDKHDKIFIWGLCAVGATIIGAFMKLILVG